MIIEDRILSCLRSINENKDPLQNKYEKYGEKWTKTDELDKKLDSLVSIKNTKETSNMAVMDVFLVDSDHYVIKLNGGLNGSGNWESYLKDMQVVIKELGDCYVIDIEVDVPDDVWVLYIGLSK
jgi:hypothetical protein